MMTGSGALLVASALSAPIYTPSSAYRSEEIEGFTVLVSPEAASHRERMQDVLAELRAQLSDVCKALPPRALGELRGTLIWVEWRARDDGAAEFHPSRVWLSANRYNPEKVEGVEINNAENFLAWSKHQPAMMLHELAHAHLHRSTDYEQLMVRSAYLSALDSGRYEKVANHDGRSLRAYALTDAQEYFAELTEAFFSRNDYYPFVRADIEAHDPEGYQVVEAIWNGRYQAENIQSDESRPRRVRRSGSAEP